LVCVDCLPRDSVTVGDPDAHRVTITNSTSYSMLFTMDGCTDRRHVLA
jgi:hypothetical protein